MGRRFDVKFTSNLNSWGRIIDEQINEANCVWMRFATAFQNCEDCVLISFRSSVTIIRRFPNHPAFAIFILPQADAFCDQWIWGMSFALTDCNFGIGWDDWCQCVHQLHGPSAILFQTDSQIRAIHGFPIARYWLGWRFLHQSKSSGSRRSDCYRPLNRIKIPASVEVIEALSFCRCWTVEEFVFFVTARMLEINRFWQWQSLSRMVIPESGNDTDQTMFDGRASDQTLIFPSRMQVRAVLNARLFRGFVVYVDNDDIKQSRGRIQASIQ
jgi:hypothetical protein